MEGLRQEYFEAILQLRDLSEEIIHFAKTEIVRAGIHVAKYVNHANGIDIYLADSNFTKALAKSLQQQFGGKYMITASLLTQKEGKKIYRLTVLFRGISFSRNDIVEYKGDDYKVISLGKEMVLQDLKTGKKKHLRYGEMEKIKKKKEERE